MVNRPYSSAHLIHTLSDLAGLSYDRYEPAKSLVNDSFTASPRWIGDPYAKNGLHKFDNLQGTQAKPEQRTSSSSTLHPDEG